MKPEGLPAEHQWAPEADEMCVGGRTKGPPTPTDISALNLNLDREKAQESDWGNFLWFVVVYP